MATPPSDDTRTLFKLLADQDWHTYESVRDALAATVPPGRALRKYEERLKASRSFRKIVDHQTTLTEDEQIFYGARACAQVTISSWKGRGIIQRVSPQGGKEIKIKPGFRAWGLDPVDQPVEPASEAQDPVSGAVPTPEVPPADSDASEPSRQGETTVSRDEGPEPVAVGDFRLQERPGQSAAVPDSAEEVHAESSLSVTASELRTCEECGLAVADQTLHDRWHERQKQSLLEQPMALFDEVTLRTLIEGILAKSLDHFQLGLQEYLDQQFSQVHGAVWYLRQTKSSPKPWSGR